MPMISFTVTEQEAQARIRAIPHERAVNAIDAHWRVQPDGTPDARSVCWLYCWAKTGMNSAKAADEARAVFNAIFSMSYESFDKRVGHEWARRARYAAQDMRDELAAQLRS